MMTAWPKAVLIPSLNLAQCSLVDVQHHCPLPYSNFFDCIVAHVHSSQNQCGCAGIRITESCSNQGAKYRTEAASLASVVSPLRSSPPLRCWHAARKSPP